MRSRGMLGLQGLPLRAMAIAPFLNGQMDRLEVFFTPTSGVISPYLQLSHEKNPYYL